MGLGSINPLEIFNIALGSVNRLPDSRTENAEARAFEKAYSGWKKNFMIDLEQGSLVVDKREGKIRVHSEGMAYGLYFSVLANDRQTFDKLLSGLENYAKKENGLYAWLLNTRGEVIEDHSATDADMYAAAAVTLAYAKWKDPRYQKVAQRLIDAVWEKEILQLEHKGYSIILPSDNHKLFVYGDGRLVYNPSYFTPSLLRLFASVDNNPKHDWNKVIQDGYRLLEEIVVQAGKLRSDLFKANPMDMNPVPDWALVNIFDGKPYLQKYSINPHKGFDAIRVYLELARDAQDPRAQKAADLILNNIPLFLNPNNVKLAGRTDERSAAYYGLLLLTSSRSPSLGKKFIPKLRKSYQENYIGRSSTHQKDYYFQSLLLHATAVLGGYKFKPEKFKGLFPEKDYQEYTPFKIFAKRDGSVYANDTLIYRYAKERQGLSPYQRAQASAQALKEAYLDGHLRSKYLEKESDPGQGSMVANYNWGLKEKPLFELGPEDFEGVENGGLGCDWITGMYRSIFGISHEELDQLKFEEESWPHSVAQSLGIKARKNILEYRWDQTYQRIYQNLIKSQMIHFGKEAELKLEHPTPPERFAHALVDFYVLTNAARAREVANYSRAYDDPIAVKRFISSFLEKNPLTGFSRPPGYYEALFSLSTILADQEGRYGTDLMREHLKRIETQVECREKGILTGMCSDFSTSLPIQGLADSRSYLEAAAKIFETIIQSNISNFGFKARALREKADLAFRVLEKGILITEDNPLPIPTIKEIVGDYLSALEIYKDQFNLSGLIIGNWRNNPSHREVMEKLKKPENYYGLAGKYTQASYKGDEFELARICLNLGRFYLYAHAREERFQELPPFDQVRYKGLKEAETWFRFVVEDPQDLFDDKRLNPYKVEALIRLGQVQMQLGLLELARNSSSEAMAYFDSALQASNQAYRKAKVEIDRKAAKDWANEGTSMLLRNIYFNVLAGAAAINLKIAKNYRQPHPSRKLIEKANSRMQEALQNKDLIIFGSTKRRVYKIARSALKELARITTDAKHLPAQKLVSILEMDALNENSFGLIDLQVVALALLAFHCLKTKKRFAELLPWKKINRHLKFALNLEKIDLDQVEKPLKLIMEKLVNQLVVPAHIRRALAEVTP